MHDTPLISFSNVSKRYPENETPSLAHVSFTVAAGEFVCLVGPSGGGKTSILKMIAGLVEPTSGRVDRPGEVAMTFQSGALLPWLTAGENVAFGLARRNLPQDELAARIERELSRVGMLALKDKHPGELSGGQRQRVGIARALALEPQVLLLDEPFSALDAKTTAELHDDLVRIWRETGKTIVMVSHLIEEAVSLAEWVLLVQHDTIDEIFRIELPYPRRDTEGFHKEVMRIRNAFFR